MQDDVVHEKQAINSKDDIEAINRLLDITYDDPMQVVHAPDVFVEQIKDLPHTELGRESYAWLLLNVAYVLRENGHILKSIQYYERAWEYCTAYAVNGLDQLLYIAKPLANLYTRIDDIEKSIALHRRAIRMAFDQGKKVYLPSLFNNLAVAYYQKAMSDSVFVMVHSGLEYSHPDSVISGLLYNTQARAYFQTGQRDSATIFNERAMRILKRYENARDTLLWYVEALKLQGDLAADERRMDEAIDYFSKAISITDISFPKAKNREKAKFRIARGQCYILLQPERAVTDFHQALSLLDSDNETLYVSDYTYSQALYGLAQSFKTIDTDSSLYYFQKTIENDYQTQQLIVSKESSYKNSLWNRQVLEAYLSLLWNRYRTEKRESQKQEWALQMFWATELSKGRQLLTDRKRSESWLADTVSEMSYKQAQLQQLEHRRTNIVNEMERQKIDAQIADLKLDFQLSEKYFERVFEVVDYQAFRRYMLQTSQTKTCISYLVNPAGQSYIITLADTVARASMLDSTQWNHLDMLDFVHAYFQESPDAYEQDPQRYQQRANALRSALLPTELKKSRSLLLSPDGTLFRVPVDALMQGDRFLAETHAVGYTYSFILDFQSPRDTIFSTPITVFAKREHGAHYGDLPFVENERRWIQRHYQSRVYREADATVESFLQQASQPVLLHIATHAVSSGSEEPFLMLDGKMMLSTLAYVPMQSPLVILSACEGAMGSVIASEGLESLNKAFLSKGVGGVIAAQWLVDDHAAAWIMQSFYQALQVSKHPQTALVQAKRAFLKQGDPVYKNPWYWASMSYMGIDTMVQIQPRKYAAVYGLMVLIVLTVSLAHAQRAYGRRNKKKRLFNKEQPFG